MSRRLLFFVLLSIACVGNLFSAGEAIKAVVVRNTINNLTDETAIITEAFNRFFKEKRITDPAEIDYYSNKARRSEMLDIGKNLKSAFSSENDSEYEKLMRRKSELEAAAADSARDNGKPKNRDALVLPVQISVISFDKFDLQALFQKSRILIDYIVSQNDCDYVLIPASIPLENNLIRARLLLYGNMTKEFSVIYDKVIRQSEFIEFARDNFTGLVGLFPYFLPDGMGIVDFPARDFGYEVRSNGERVEDNSMFAEGRRKFVVSSPGYEDAEVEIDVRKNAVNELSFDLKEKINGRVFLSSDGPMYKAFSTDKGSFDLPDFISDYKTPQSISFSYPNRSTKYISLLDNISKLNISLKPNYLLDPSYSKAEVKDFYSTVLLSISIFAIDILSRSFLRAYPDSAFWQISQKTASYLGYFSISLVVINLFDYFYSMVYAFE